MGNVNINICELQEVKEKKDTFTLTFISHEYFIESHVSNDYISLEVV